MIFFPQSHIFPSPEPPLDRRRIYPLFLPFSGCVNRCAFCSQPAQTGTGAADVQTALERAGRDLLERERKSPASALGLDLAFFGGTFTALTPEDLRACLDFAVAWQERGVISRVRCSTRPDAVNAPLLASLKAAGFSLVELGVQSFDDAALQASGRGYSAAGARRACELVQASDLELGIQLMPGLPGSTPESAMRDVEECAALAPSCARLYPCLVLEETPLATVWRQGGYIPWPLEQALDFLGPACLALWRAGVPVIRMGLAQEAGLEEKVLAGPRHPDLGGMAKGLALYLYLHKQISTLPRGDGSILSLHVPEAWQGAFFGQSGSLAPLYAALGIPRKAIHWWNKGYFALTPFEQF
jgi:histone acetyltransferase (RNA polymerase elongator complex component)